ncbi:purine and uridine phosphorylase [Aspergillus californicus]
MQLQYELTTAKGTENINLVDIVADISVALSEALKKSPQLYHGLGRSLAILVLEIGHVDFEQRSATSRKLQHLLGRLVGCLDSAIRGAYVQAKYQQLTDSKAKTGFQFALFRSWGASPVHASCADKWKEFPYPSLGMLSELVGSQIRDEIRLEELLSDDRQVIDRLKKQIKDWNKMVDLAYEGAVDEYEENAGEGDGLKLFIKESAFCGEDSIRRLSGTLYEVLHYNWPCCMEDHDHKGQLGHCFSAKLRLDPSWSCRGLDPRDDSFFVLLTGSGIIQECKVCLQSSGTTGETDTLLCQVSHEDSRLVCLHLAKDANNRLWPQSLGQPPETLHPDEQYIEQTLGNLLHVIKPTYAAKRVLGVILARSFLHLLGGPWIPRSFCIDDILLFCRVEADRPYPLFDKIFLSTTFGQSASSEAKQRSSFSVHPFPAILALGIILTEIELGDDLPELYRDPILARLKNRPFELAKYLLRECSRRFHDSGLLRAVKFCTERESFLRFANTSIDSLFSNQEFVNAFYLGAVRPLEQDLVTGAKWTWAEVQWLQRANSDDEGVCKIITKFQTEAPYERQQRPSLTTLSEEDSPLSLASKCPLGTPPIRRDDFEVAIICALPLEANAVLSLFDQFFDSDQSLAHRDPGDPNSYSMGVMEGRNVVLAHQPAMGKATAASVAAFCATSFRRVKLALLVGVCGGIPLKYNKEEIMLGDVIISKAVMQYDFGRQFSDGFRRKIDVQHSLGRPNARISSLLAKLETQVHRKRLQQEITQHLLEIDDPVLYPGEWEDKLFPPSYRHKHQRVECCTTCADCDKVTDPTCQRALEATCGEVQCDDTNLVRRAHQNQRNAPSVHIGLIASGDSVIKSGIHRDAISKEAGVLGFEMEGAGVWDIIPCVIIKGVCDYADSHKNKLWQGYAAATAAACAKAFVRQW